jgi:FRG domain.
MDREPPPDSPAASFPQIEIDSWDAFRRHMEDEAYRGWAFRGQADARLPLYTSLGRNFRERGIRPEAWPLLEERILRIFRRKSHHFLESVPDADDAFEWLALMQHHGAPTRLLDFTWSPYVAAFFALEGAIRDAVVWAVSPPRLAESVRRFLRDHTDDVPEDPGPWVPGNYEKLFLPNRHPIVVIGEPYRMNRRLIAQSGTFVVPGLLDRPLEQIVSGSGEGAPLVQFVLRTEKIRQEAIRSLYQMNLTYATLFPDLDGLARSMAWELEIHWAFDPTSMEPFPGYRLDRRGNIVAPEATDANDAGGSSDGDCSG